MKKFATDIFNVLSPKYLNNLLKKVIKYCISGGMGAIIDFGIYSLLIYFFSLNYIISNIISFTCGSLATYYLQKNWTFQCKSTKHLFLLRKYVIVVAITYVLNSLLLILFIQIFTINVFYAKILQILVSTIWGYSINNLYTFKESGEM